MWVPPSPLPRCGATWGQLGPVGTSGDQLSQSVLVSASRGQPPPHCVPTLTLPPQILGPPEPPRYPYCQHRGRGGHECPGGCTSDGGAMHKCRGGA